ncbi:MAG: twitching motility protein, partial [Desulfobacterales bacterium]
MKKQEIDHLLARMLDAYDNVSDLNITVGKPFQVETAGDLAVVDLKPTFKEITPFQSEIFALNLIN